jgi:T5SS/PEP-CTERM-associated repeat protein/autotransporter-associated beta strand protein
VLAALLVAGVVPADLRADHTILDSGTTTLSTGTNFGDSLYVATTGTATLKVNAGGHATNNEGLLGHNRAAFGTVTVESGGRWTNSDYLTVGVNGTGTLNVTGGRVTNTDGYLGRYETGVGTATVSSGTWANSGGPYLPGLYVGSKGTGTLNVTGGTVTNDAIGYIGDSSKGHGTATVRSGTWANGESLMVGHAGTGTLNVTGGNVTNTSGYIGYFADSVGTATVSSGTWANSGDLTVGYEGTGTLNVTGGNVTNASGYLGYNAGSGRFADSVGTATVSSGTWANSGGLAVGNSGTGTLEVNGGTVTNDAIGYIGRYAEGHGTATVSSGTWANGNLAVGNHGTGILNVTGGSVTNTNGYIGRFAASDGTATVSSGTWASSGNLTVGDEGTGSLTMSGGLVTVGGTLLRGAGGTIHLNSGGTLQIGTGTTGGVLGNNLTNNGTLIFNRSDAYTYGGIISGTGSVTKQGGGTLTLGAANSYSGGTTISDGVLALGSANAVGASGTIRFGGGTLQYSTSNTTDYSSRFSTSASQAYSIDTNGQNVTWASPLASSGGTLTKSGTGALTLAGANSYSGVTTISGGVLALSGSGSIGTGDLNLGSGGVFDLTALAAGTYSLPSTGDLIGSGTLTGNGRTLAVLGAFQPGNSPGTVTVDAGFTLDLSGATSTTFDITDPLFTAGTYDLVNGNGSMIFGGILNLTFSGGSYDNDTDVLQLFANTGGFSGDFTSVVSTGLAAGQFATFNATTGFISITAVPEPSTYAMALAGLACGGWQMFRRRRLRQAPTLAA